MANELLMVGVDGGEYGETFLVQEDGILAIRGYNQGGHDLVDINLKQLIKWIRKNKFELLTDPETYDG